MDTWEKEQGGAGILLLAGSTQTRQENTNANSRATTLVIHTDQHHRKKAQSRLQMLLSEQSPRWFPKFLRDLDNQSTFLVLQVSETNLTSTKDKLSTDTGSRSRYYTHRKSCSVLCSEYVYYTARLLTKSMLLTSKNFSPFFYRGIF
ncbi:hypothetical protein ACRRTK_012820 [Alexandromys fortis]